MAVVYKFGGASVRSVAAIKQVAGIIQSEKNPLVVIVSAMGKTTNALEEVWRCILQGKGAEASIKPVISYHQAIVQELFGQAHPLLKQVERTLIELKDVPLSGSSDRMYDQIVSAGELVSTAIVAEFLIASGVPALWVDARKIIQTDDNYREARIDWDATEANMRAVRTHLDHRSIVVTQGFIGHATNGDTTTLGRDGSDFSAAIFASCLKASAVTIWKDVPGVMNADPKRLPEAEVFDELPFGEAAEMTYYGASVIHPKTIKPLANRGIPLWVKSFDDPTLPGTLIHETTLAHIPPLIVFKENQCLVSCRVTDYTFINEKQLMTIFKAIAEVGVKINVMQNSAISFSFCIDYREDKVMKLIEVLAGEFEVYYNTGLTLITIKNYDRKTSDAYRSRPGILMEQASRSTLQLLVR